MNQQLTAGIVGLLGGIGSTVLWYKLETKRLLPSPLSDSAVTGVIFFLVGGGAAGYVAHVGLTK